MPALIEYTYECADTSFTVVARDREEAFAKAEQEAALRGLHDALLCLVDECSYDPSGGDGDED